jgi:Outer membrane protein beta-barrel domain
MRVLTFSCVAGVLMLLCSLQARCQLYLGVEGGPNMNYLTTSNASEPFTRYDGMRGWNIGIPVGYRFFDWLSVQAAPTYIQKNYDIVRTGFFAGVYQKNYNTYLQLPLSLRFSFGGKALRGFVDLGGYAAYWKSSRIQGVEANILNGVDTAYETVNPTSILGENYGYSYNQSYTFNSTRDNRFELGLIGGLGVSYELFQTYTFYLEGRYFRAMTDQEKHYETSQAPRYDDNYGVTLGATVEVNKIIPTLFKKHSRS